MDTNVVEFFALVIGFIIFFIIIFISKFKECKLNVIKQNKRSEDLHFAALSYAKQEIEWRWNLTKETFKALDDRLNKSYSSTRTETVNTSRGNNYMPCIEGTAIRKRYKVVKTDQEGKAGNDAVRKLFSDLHSKILALVPEETKYRERALFKLEDAFLLATKAISRANAVEE